MDQMSCGRAADAVVLALEAQIIEGKLPEGLPLPTERALMEDFGTSRIVIREAIMTLAGRGLLTIRPRCRPIVCKPGYASVLRSMEGGLHHMLSDPEGIRSLHDSRVFLERALVREAALTATEEDIAVLRAALAVNQAAMDSPDDFYETDMAFHGVLYQIPRNSILPVVHQAYVAWLTPRRHRNRGTAEENLIRYQGHVAILNAIVDRDPLTAEAVIVGHLSGSWSGFGAAVPDGS